MTPLDAVAAAIRERLLAGQPAPLPGLGTLVRTHVSARVEERADGKRVLLPPGETIGLAPTEPGHESLASAFGRFREGTPAQAQAEYSKAMDQVEALLSATGEVRLPGVGLLRRTSGGVVLGVEADLLAAVNRTYEGLSPVGAGLPTASAPQPAPPAPRAPVPPATAPPAPPAPEPADAAPDAAPPSPPRPDRLPWEAAEGAMNEALSADQPDEPASPAEDADTPPQHDPFEDELLEDAFLESEALASENPEDTLADEHEDERAVQDSAEEPDEAPASQDTPPLSFGDGAVSRPPMDHPPEAPSPSPAGQEAPDAPTEDEPAQVVTPDPSPTEAFADQEPSTEAPSDPDASPDPLSPLDGAFLDDEALDEAFDDVFQAPFGSPEAPPLAEVLPQTPPDRDPLSSTDDWERDTWTSPLASTPSDDDLSAGSAIEEAEFTVLPATSPEAEMNAALVDLAPEPEPVVAAPPSIIVPSENEVVVRDEEPRRRSWWWLVVLLLLAALAAAAFFFWPEIRALVSPDPTSQQTVGTSAAPAPSDRALVSAIDAEQDSAALATGDTLGDELDALDEAVRAADATFAEAAITEPTEPAVDLTVPEPRPSRAADTSPAPPASRQAEPATRPRASGAPSTSSAGGGAVNVAPPVITGLSRAEATALSSRQPVERGADAWTLVVFSTPSRADAQATHARYARAGYRTTILSVTVRGTTQHRVAVGQFGSRADAIRLRNRLPPEAPADTWPLDLQTL